MRACDATAALVTATLDLLAAEPPWATCWPVADLVQEGARRRPPARQSRRVAATDLDEAGLVSGRSSSATSLPPTHDPEVFDRPSLFDPGRPGRRSLTFGYGIRPFLGEAHALALASGVVEAILTGDARGGHGRALSAAELTRATGPDG